MGRIQNAWDALRGKQPATSAKASFADLQQARTSPHIEPAAPATVYGGYFLTNTAVYRAVHLRSEAVSSAPLTVMQESADGEMEPAGPDNALQVTLDKMNNYWSSADVIYATEQYLSIWGGAYWFVDKNERVDGGLASVWVLRPDRMIPVPDQNNYIQGYKYKSPQGKDLVFLPDEIVWFRRINPLDEYASASPVAPGRASFDMGSAATRFNRNFFMNDAMPSDLAIIYKDELTDEEYEEFQIRLKKRHSGVGNAHTPLIISGNEADVKNLSFSQRDMEFMSALQWTVEDASRVFGVMPPLMMDREHTTLDNVKQARLEFYQSTVNAEWRFIEREINELLLPIFGRDVEGLVVQFDTTNVPTVQEARSLERVSRIQEVKDGLMTINEFRAREGLEPVDWGDVWWANASLVPIDSAEVDFGDAPAEDEDADLFPELPDLEDEEAEDEEPEDEEQQSIGVAEATKILRQLRKVNQK